MKEIKMPVYYIIEETWEKHYDWEEMANELENRISETLNKEVSITIQDEGFIELKTEEVVDE